MFRIKFLQSPKSSNNKLIFTFSHIILFKLKFTKTLDLETSFKASNDYVTKHKRHPKHASQRNCSHSPALFRRANHRLRRSRTTAMLGRVYNRAAATGVPVFRGAPGWEKPCCSPSSDTTGRVDRSCESSTGRLIWRGSRHWRPPTRSAMRARCSTRAARRSAA